MRKVRSTKYPDLVYYREEDIALGDLCEKGAQLRPHIVWFGEAVPMIEKAAELVYQADIFVVIGTSMQVYPAAGLIHFVPDGAPIYFIDPHPNIHESYYSNLTVIEDTAVGGTEELLRILIG